MAKRILVSSTDLMMVQFLLPHIRFLAEQGYEVEIACSDVGGRMEEIRAQLEGYVKQIHVVRLVRSPVSPTNLKGYRDMKQVVDQGHYDLIWTNEPVMGVATRLAARKARRSGTKVIYMVHGFHFYHGAPKLNWIVFYPIEKLMSHFCDRIVTMNGEDRKLAESRFSTPVSFIHGIGVNGERFHPVSTEERLAVRKKEGLSKEDFVVICIGELNENKNQKTLIEAAALVRDRIPGLKVLLAGKGDQEQALRTLIQEKGLENAVRLLGYRKDLPHLLPAVDLAVSCSRREGLPQNIIEAMLCKKPVVASHNRGHDELVVHEETGLLFSFQDAAALANALCALYEHPDLRAAYGEKGCSKAMEYTVDSTRTELLQLLEQTLNG